MRAFARDVAGRLLFSAGVTTPRRFGRDRLNIVTFHRVLPDEQRRRYPYPMLAVTPEELAWFVDFFRHHFLVTTLEQAFRLFGRGDLHPERPLLAITFDDAQVDNLVHAAPVLESRGLRASFYVPVDAVQTQEPLWHDRLGFALLGADRARLTRIFGGDVGSVEEVVEVAKTWTPELREARVRTAVRLAGAPVPEWARLMTWDELRRLARAGHEIGSHSLSHAILPQLDDAEIEREVAVSKRRIEEAIDREVISFCYPNGDTDERAALAVARAGYRCAVTTTWGTNKRGSDVFRLRRSDMNAAYSRNVLGRMSPARVAWRMSGLHPGL